MSINRMLFASAWEAAHAEKLAFVPPGAPPGAAPPGGAPPMDPAAMGGAPPGGAPPMDPAAMGGAASPPMDPAAMGAAAPPADPAAAGGAPPPATGGGLEQKLDLLIQTLQQNGGGQQQSKPKGGGKVDPQQMMTYMQRNQKLMTHMYNAMGIPLPPDILDEPAPEADSGGGGGGGGGSSGGTSKKAENPTGIQPIKPISPIGGTKMASVSETAAGLMMILQRMSQA